MLEFLIFIIGILVFFAMRKTVKNMFRVSHEFSVAYQKESFIALRRRGDEINKKRKEVEGMPLPSEIPD